MSSAAVWSYPNPEPGFESIGNHFAFHAGRVDACYVGGQRVVPQPGNEDEYRQAVLVAVDRKVAGEEIVIVEEPDRRDQIIDLVAALKESLANKMTSVAKPKRVRTTAKVKASPGSEKRAATKKAAAK